MKRSKCAATLQPTIAVTPIARPLASPLAQPVATPQAASCCGAGIGRSRCVPVSSTNIEVLGIGDASEGPDFLGPTSENCRPLTEIQRAELDAGTRSGAGENDGRAQARGEGRNTRRAYRAGWREFAAWCQASKVRDPCPPSRPSSPRTSRRKPAGSSPQRSACTWQPWAMRTGSPSTQIRRAASRSRRSWTGSARTYEVTPTRKDPLLTGDVKAIAARRPDDLRGHRDRAIVLTGFCAGRRRVELENLVVEDLAFCADGVLVHVRKSKTDQVGAGHEVGLGYAEQETACPVTALRRWLAVSGITTGPLFRAIDRHGRLRARGLSGKAIAKIVKRLGAELGLDPKKLGGHSLRRGFVTSADAANVPERDIMQVTAHRSRSGIEP